MFRSPSLPLHDFEDLSSPDPLANSSGDSAPAATRSPTRSSSPPKRRLSSPAKTSRSKRSVQHFSSPLSSHSFAQPPVSPSRTVTEQTLSPWKIRVTVEAEHEDGDEAGEAMTRTIKVPLREESSPSNADRTLRRGRLATAPPARTKRSVTPTRRNASHTPSRRQSVTDLNIAPLGDDGDGDEWTGKKPSPRKKRASRSKRAQSEQSEGPLVEDNEDSNILNENMKHASRANPPFEIHEDADAATGIEQKQLADQPSPSMFRSPELRQIDLNRVSVRQRSQSTKRKEGRSEWSDKMQGSELGHGIPMQSARQVSATSVASYPTPSPTSSYHGSDEVEKTADAAHGQEHFDTMLESEGFTMIDLDSIPSATQYRTSPEEQKSVREQMGQEATNGPGKSSGTPATKMTAGSSQKKPTPIPSYLAIADDVSELSSNVPSSPPLADTSMLAVPTRPMSSGDRKVTPQTYSSPSLPPPPPVQKAPSSTSRPESPPREVLHAGVALQDAVISPNDNMDTSSQHESLRIPAPRRSDFFNGFSSGTNRELRAGLRFGEELAKRQRPTSSSSTGHNDGSSIDRQIYRDNVKALLKPQMTTQIWRGETTVQHSPFATAPYSQTKQSDHERLLNGRMGEDPLLSSKTTTVTTTTNASSKLANSNTQTPKTSPAESSDTQLSKAAGREDEWQLKREVISRKIKDAEPDQVVVIDSDDDESLSDARRSSSLGEGTAPAERQEAVGHGREHRMERGNIPKGRSEAEQTEDQTRKYERQAQGISVAKHHPVPGLGEGAREVEAAEADAEDDDEDIWLQEAKDNSSSPRDPDAAGTFTRTEQQRQRERAGEVVTKPRRSLIPSPWKRGEDVAEASTLMSDGAMSGFFWQQPTPVQDAIKFGAGEIARQKRQSTGNFDLETMLSSPVKLAAVGRKNLTLLKSDDDAHKSEDQVADIDEEDEVEQEDIPADDVSEEEQDVADVAESKASSPSSQLPPQTVPVNFNDSTMSVVATPPRQKRPSPTEVAERARLTPPRSAMKGARLSFSPPKQDPQSDIRRVVFNERSLYLNSDGDESTMSAHLDSPRPDPKPSHGFQNANADADAEEVVDHREWLGRQKKRSSWLSWMLPGKTSESDNTQAVSTPSIPKVDGAGEGPAEDNIKVEVQNASEQVEDQMAEEIEHWQSTKTSVSTNSDHPRPSYSPLTEPETEVRHPQQSHASYQDQRAHVRGKSNPIRPTDPPANGSSHPVPDPQPTPQIASSVKLPSYLVSPSYPSDPSRDTTVPLPVSGEFTNAHFRTLHIIHAKSLRPRFHAPKRVRSSIRKLVGWKMEVDESGSIFTLEGAVFEWTLGDREAAVLERFMQEVEFGHVVAGTVGVGGKVKWGWSVEDLARNLGMIVVGEAVRAEE